LPFRREQVNGDQVMTVTSPGHAAEADKAFPGQAGNHWIHALDDGTPVLIRPIRPEDRVRESDFIKRLSPESRHFRFLCEIREPDPALLDLLVDVHEVQGEAFVALAHVDGELREVGVSRFAATADGGCECAVTVADDWQRHGLGVLLMRHLIDLARDLGFRRMYSIDAAANQSMRDLASFLGFHRGVDPEDSTQVIHTLNL
jgi:GNAT superfamily N-acetyltransferase